MPNKTRQVFITKNTITELYTFYEECPTPRITGKGDLTFDGTELDRPFWETLFPLLSFNDAGCRMLNIEEIDNGYIITKRTEANNETTEKQKANYLQPSGPTGRRTNLCNQLPRPTTPEARTRQPKIQERSVLHSIGKQETFSEDKSTRMFAVGFNLTNILTNTVGAK
jgi:hypothetical protein